MINLKPSESCEMSHLFWQNTNFCSRLKTNDVTHINIFRAIEILDEMLEDYVGIRDRELCVSMYDSGCSAADSSVFHSSIQNDYPMFSFSDDFILDIWAIISDAQAQKMPEKKQG